jgi:hypothetical protein
MLYFVILNIYIFHFLFKFYFYKNTLFKVNKSKKTYKIKKLITYIFIELFIIQIKKLFYSIRKKKYKINIIIKKTKNK